MQDAVSWASGLATSVWSKVASGRANQAIATGVAIAGVAVLGLRRYCAGGSCKYAPDLSGGNWVLITGANTGIGRETAHYLVNKCKAKVIIGCRDVEKANEAKQYIGGANTEVMRLDLADQASIRAFVEALKASGKKLDILINNAGVMMCPAMMTKDGYEMQFGTNHLGHFTLTNLLLSNNLINDKSGRIVNLSSRGHQMAPKGTIQFDDIMFAKNYDRLAVYGQSKLANVLFAAELQRKLKAKHKSILVFSLHPGVVRTELVRHLPFADVAQFLLYPLAWTIMKSPLEGAQTSLHCALAPEAVVAPYAGQYFADCAPATVLSAAKPDSVEVTSKLWDVSVELTHLKPEEKWWL